MRTPSISAGSCAPGQHFTQSAGPDPGCMYPARLHRASADMAADPVTTRHQHGRLAHIAATSTAAALIPSGAWTAGFRDAETLRAQAAAAATVQTGKRLFTRHLTCRAEAFTKRFMSSKKNLKIMQRNSIYVSRMKRIYARRAGCWSCRSRRRTSWGASAGRHPRWRSRRRTANCRSWCRVPRCEPLLMDLLWFC